MIMIIAFIYDQKIDCNPPAVHHIELIYADCIQAPKQSSFCFAQHDVPNPSVLCDE